MRLLAVSAILAAVAMLGATAAHAGSGARAAGRVARDAAKRGPDALRKGQLAGAIGQTTGDFPKTQVVGGFEVMAGSGPSRVIVLTPGPHRGYRAQRAYDYDGTLETSFGDMPGGLSYSYSPKTGVVARERRDGTWGIQMVRGGHFSKQAIVADRNAARAWLWP